MPLTIELAVRISLCTQCKRCWADAYKTWLKFRDETSSKTPRPRLQNLCILPNFFKRRCYHFWVEFFSHFWHFRRVLVVSYLQIQQTKNRWII